MTNLTVRTDNRLASSEPNEPNHAGLSASHSVWWTWTAPVTGKFAVQTVGSSYRTVIAVYQGTVLSNLAALTASAAYPEARVCFLAEEGEAYQFALDGYYWASGDTTLWLIHGVPGKRRFCGSPNAFRDERHRYSYNYIRYEGAKRTGASTR